MTTLTNSIPDYEPKTDWKDFKKVDMNIRDLQQNYVHGCKCCGNIYNPGRYSALIQHFKTQKHKKLCLDSANQTFSSDMNEANDMNTAYEEKCKENRKLKQLNYNYKEEINMLKKELDKLSRKQSDLISLL